MYKKVTKRRMMKFRIAQCVVGAIMMVVGVTEVMNFNPLNVTLFIATSMAVGAFAAAVAAFVVGVGNYFLRDICGGVY